MSNMKDMCSDLTPFFEKERETEREREREREKAANQTLFDMLLRESLRTSIELETTIIL